MICVSSCRYLRISCTEDDHPLFRRYYARSNRERGVKLLRCFPHCCPEHVQRCYCGTSIHILVAFSAVVPAASQKNLVVCARFEPSRLVSFSPNLVNLVNCERIDNENQRKLQPGEIVSLPENLLLAEKYRTKETVWIRADREGDMKQKYQDAVLFVLNNHRFPKWLYSYNSSITRIKREMTHHLVAYVFHLTGKRSKPNEMDAVVLARHESPGFLLVSYRRSGNTSGCDLPAIDMANSNMFAAVEIDSPGVCPLPSDDLKINSVGRTVFETSYQKMDTKRSDTRQRQLQFSCNHQRLNQEEKRQQNMQSDAGGSSVSSFFETTNDTYSWQRGMRAKNCRFQEKGQHLLILWIFFQSFSLSDLKISTESITEHVCSHWLRAAAILRSPSPSSSRQLKTIVISFLSGIFGHQPGINTTVPFATERDTLQVTALLFLWTMSSHSVQCLLHSACSFINAETSKAELQTRFVLLVSDLYDAIGDVLQEVSAQTTGLSQRQKRLSLPALVDDVLSLVYSRPRFHQLRSRVSALLLGQQIYLSQALNGVFQVFTAVIRERLIASATPYRTSPRLQHSLRRSSLPELWNHCWLLEPRSVNIVDVSRGVCTHDMRSVDVVQLWSEFGCVDVTIQDDMSSISLRSAVSFLDHTAVAPMTLVLDGKLRLFRVLPSGVSSMIPTAGGWSIGDYTAIFLANENSLKVNFFCFAEEKARAFVHSPIDSRDLEPYIYAEVIRLRRVCISIRLEENLNHDGVNPTNLFAVVRGIIYDSIYSPPSQRMDGLKFSERRVCERAAIWGEVKWKPLLELQAESVPYIAYG
ncbi:unnamed protein product [Peronospora destructor]|uniref:Anaphase-promoting complex subunit 1 n=1 Tax=Peronospora destructor TaxID=86335 RepID=A0AAV0TL46_9STRA|nr:unnamed protein product [Peronospora destructor]